MMDLEDIVTGLPLDGGKISPATTHRGIRACWPHTRCRWRRLYYTNEWAYRINRTCRIRYADTAEEADRALLLASLEETQERPGGLRISGEVVIWETTHATGRIARKLVDVQAHVPGFDWTKIGGYQEPAPELGLEQRPS